MEYSEREVEELIRVARVCMELSVRSPSFHPEIVEQQFNHIRKGGSVVVRLIDYPTNTIYGTSDIIDSINVVKAVVQATLSAEFDAGKLSLPPQRIDEIVIELNLLENPQKLSSSAPSREREIDAGKHGLMVEYGARKSILLPSYAAEHGMDNQRFLEEACELARLPRDYWKQPSTTIYKFAVERYIEEAPSGSVKRL